MRGPASGRPQRSRGSRSRPWQGGRRVYRPPADYSRLPRVWSTVVFIIKRQTLLCLPIFRIVSRGYGYTLSISPGRCFRCTFYFNPEQHISFPHERLSACQIYTFPFLVGQCSPPPDCLHLRPCLSQRKLMQVALILRSRFQTTMPPLCKDGTISAYHSGNATLFVDDSGMTIHLEQTGSQAYLLTVNDGVIHTVFTDEYGCTTCDGEPLADIIYRRKEGDPVTYGCVLMSTSKMTVEQAAAPTQFVASILACFGNVPAQIAMAIANFAFNWTVTQHRDMWLTMEHWYCDTPKMITRKVWTLYEDQACTKFVKSWTSEAPVGVEI